MNTGRTPQILIVDDNGELREMLQLALEELGYCVRVAEDGHQALRIFQANPIDLVLSDIYLPGISGYTLYAELCKTRTVPVIFISGSKSVQDQQDALALGASAFLSKPLEFADIVRSIQQVL